jgi:hypothetical protein
MNTESATSEPFLWTETFGRNICLLAGTLGVSTEDVALATASLLGNIAGYNGGLHDVFGEIVTPGFNLSACGDELQIGPEAIASLLRPLLRVQDALRTTAAQTAKRHLNTYVFGFPDIVPDYNIRGRPEPWYDRALKIYQGIANLMAARATHYS